MWLYIIQIRECEWKFQAWLLKISCAICYAVLSLRLADWVGWVGEVVDSSKTLEVSGSTWWERAAQEYAVTQLQVEQLYSVKWKKVKSVSRVQLFAAPWTVAHQAPPSMEFSRQEYWSGLPLPSPGDLPDPGIEPGSPAMQADAQMLYRLSHQGSPIQC